MSSCNTSMLIGNLGSDVELRESDSGTPVCNLSLAVDRVYYRTLPDGNRERVKTTDWIPVTVWGSLAENCSKWLKKGSLIGVRGSLRLRQYNNRSGDTVRTLEVRAEAIDFLNNIRSRDEVEAMEAMTHQPPA